MTNAVLLSAGQGRRLSPLTDSKPKCLITIGGRTILEWQLLALAACGIRDVTVVTGFEDKSVETALKVSTADVDAVALFNPFYGVADNIGSCWVARDLLSTTDCVLINGDTLFDPRILHHVLTTATAPINVTIDSKSVYDADDMKVKTDGQRLTHIGKTLTGQIDGESIGMLRFRNEGGAAFVGHMEALLRDQASLKKWYLTIIDQLASETDGPLISPVSIAGLPWAEVDFPHDIPFAAERIAAFDWTEQQETGQESVDDSTTVTPRLGAL
ncbi:MAG: phosphocholine cytidylyltransferase family protein [Alphaproteobacteria bacterium]